MDASFPGQGKNVGGATRPPADNHERRVKALAAAEVRRTTSSSSQGGTSRKLGGASNERVDVRELMRRSAESRLTRDNAGCSTKAKPVAVFHDGGWVCTTCAEKNLISASTCSFCGIEYLMPPTPHLATGISGHNNEIYRRVRIEPRDEVSDCILISAAVKESSDDTCDVQVVGFGWICETCTYHSRDSDRLDCEICGDVRPKVGRYEVKQNTRPPIVVIDHDDEVEDDNICRECT
jgi:hypothetical protein